MLRVIGLLGVLVLAAAEGESPNALTPAEAKAGFELLFNGKDTDGWEHKGNWKVVDGVLTREGKGGDLTYKAKKVPDDFELRFEWKVAPKSNSGVYYRPGQYEYQILDNALHDALVRLGPLVGDAVTASWVWQKFTDAEKFVVHQLAHRLAELMDRGAYQERVIGSVSLALRAGPDEPPHPF